MPKTTVALLNEFREAEQLVQELVEAGFPRDAIGVVATEAACRRVTDSGGDAATQGAAAGVEKRVGAGAAIGGAGGFALGMIAVAVPGIGPVLAAGPLAAGLLGAGVGAGLGAAAGAATGGALRGFTELGISHEEADCYCEAVRRGGIVVTLESSDEDAERAADIMGRHRLLDIDECAAGWRRAGWTGYDASAEPLAATPDGISPATIGLPFDPQSINPRQRRERRERRAVRSYVRVR